MKKYIIYSFLFPCIIYGQTRIIDSLKLELKKTTNDTTKIKQLTLLGYYKYLISPDSAMNAWEKGFKLSAIYLEKCNCKETELRSIRKKQIYLATNIGYLYKIQRKFETALVYYNTALKLEEDIGNKNGIYNAHRELASIYNKQLNSKMSHEEYKKCLEIGKELNDEIIIAKTLFDLGHCFNGEGDIPQAINNYKESLALWGKLKNNEEQADCVNNLGVIYFKIGEIDSSLNYFNVGLKLHLIIGDKRRIANSYNNLGLVYKNYGEIDKVVEYYKLSLSLREEIKDKKGITTSLYNIGLLYDEKGEYIKALDYFKKCLGIRREMNDFKGEVYPLNSIGGIFLSLGDEQNAEYYYNECLKISTTVQDMEMMAYSNNNLANLFEIKKTFNIASEYYKKSLELFKQTGNKSGIAYSLNNIGNLNENQFEYNVALENYNKSYDFFNELKDIKGMSIALYGMGKIYKYRNDLKSAIYYAKISQKLALEIGYNEQLIKSNHLLFNCYIKNDYADSSLKILTFIFSSLNRSLENNYSTLSEKEKELFFSTLENDYMLYFDFTNSYKNKIPNLTDTTFNISLKNKGLTLKSSTAMRNSILRSGDSMLIKEYEEWRGLKKIISKLYESNKDTKELDNQANDLEKELVKKSTAFSDFDKVKNLDWKQVQKGLKNNEAAIEFVHFKSEIDTTNPTKYAALIVKPESVHPEMITLCNESDLESILGTFQGNNLGFVNKVYGTKKEAQTALYEKIWEPLEQSLKGVKNVYYSPSGLLHKISFAAISKSNNTYLCDAYQMHQQSSTGKVALQDKINYSIDDEFMVEGGVKYNSTQTHNEVWKYLPGTLSETQNIQKLLTENKNKVNYFVSENASEENFKKNIVNANILHVATHGFFFPDPEIEREKIRKANAEKKDTVATINETNNKKEEELVFRGTTNYANWSFVNNKNPLMRSGLVLANANDVWERDQMTEGEDGILTAQEVSNLDMRKTKLVVLSACETGLGDIKGSEGVYGLQRAFKMAGVKYIIMSLWQVPDKETSEFMTTFYKKLLKEKDIKKAFNQTQKEMRKKYDPYFWAAFVLVE